MSAVCSDVDIFFTDTRVAVHFLHWEKMDRKLSILLKQDP